MHRRHIPSVPGAFEGGEVLIAFAISTPVALFHKSGRLPCVSACVNWISDGRGKRVSLKIATLCAKVAAVVVGV